MAVESESPDAERRAALAAATTGLGAVGLCFSGVPFIASWLPSERARALGGPVAVDGGGIGPGQMRIVTWRRQPVYIVRRTAAMLAQASGHDARLKDAASRESQQPPYADNPLRSREPSLLVVVGVCTHLGCLPRARFDADAGSMGPEWPGGFVCPCHGSRFDLSGRVFKGSPASVNLVVPPYTLSGDDQIVIGVDT